VRGTEYGAQISRAGLDDDGKPLYETEFYGYEGEVEIENEFGSQILRANETIRAVLGAIPGVPVPGLDGVAGTFFNILTSDDPEEAVKDEAEKRIEQEIRKKIPGGIGRMF
jgi:hypothetical protein